MTPLVITLAETAGQVDRARRLCAALSDLYTDSRAALVHSRQLCGRYRRIAGGTDLEMPYLVEILAKSAMCVSCLQRRTGIPTNRARQGIERIRTFMQVIEHQARCDSCLTLTTTYRLDGGPGRAAPADTRRAAPSQGEALWWFLQNRRGLMLCAQCIADGLGVVKRIDRAILAAEGRGALRRYGACASCGRERLLCGLPR